jgi:Bacterial mobilisation protein (MobC)
MARHKRTYTGERLTARIAVMMTPSEREALEKGAAGQGTPTLSAYARDLLSRPLAGAASAPRRNPDAPGLMRALTLAGGELNAIGNNLNQIARHLNTTGELGAWDDLPAALKEFRQIADQLKAAITRVLEL